jgi:hypothetical protein
MSTNRLEKIATLFQRELSVISVGLDRFAQTLTQVAVPVTHLAWKPPALQADVSLATQLQLQQVAATPNAEAVSRLLQGRPVLVEVRPASEVIPGMRDTLVLHAGPPLDWQRMCGPLRGAIIGGLLFQGLARSQREAAKLAASGQIAFAPNHQYGAVGPMAGVTTARMPVWVVENQRYGNRAFCTLNEGLGKVLRYGAYAPEVLKRLRWMETELAPMLRDALIHHGAMDLKHLIAQALGMGDEVHNRNKAATSLFTRELAAALAAVHGDRAVLQRVLAFLRHNDHFFLNLSMAAAKATADAARGIAGSSMVTCMARNGTEFGIQVAGLDGQWFTGPAGLIEGLYFPGYSSRDAAPDMGDSVITETVGLGGFAMAAAPAIGQFVGGTPQDAVAYTESMYDITLAESDVYQIPGLGFRGTPSGIDLLRVVESGILPIINTGIAHKRAGVGMIGAGLVRPPWACFTQALTAFAERYAR